MTDLTPDEAAALIPGALEALQEAAHELEAFLPIAHAHGDELGVARIRAILARLAGTRAAVETRGLGGPEGGRAD
jgi:hypothetical protein